jgi:hypothetical protein
VLETNGDALATNQTLIGGEFGNGLVIDDERALVGEVFSKLEQLKPDWQWIAWLAGCGKSLNIHFFMRAGKGPGPNHRSSQ